MTRVLTLHSTWDAEHPEAAEYRRVTHPDSEHPCPGVLRCEDSDAEDHAPSIVRCDACGWSTTVRLTSRHATPDPAAQAAPF